MKVLLGVFLPILMILSCLYISSCEGAANGACNSSKSITVVPGNNTHILSKGILSRNNFSVSFEQPNASFEIQRSNKGIGLSIYAKPNVTFHATLTSSTCTVNLIIRTLPCPPGFQLNSSTPMDTLACICFGFKKDPFPIIHCDNASLSIKVRVGYCVNYEKSGVPNIHYTRCPFSGHQNTMFIPLIYNYDDDNNTAYKVSFCSALHRQEGNFCHECSETYCVSVYSDTFRCFHYGKHKRHSTQILSYLAIETIPATIFFMVVLYFHIGVTSAPANGFIFFSQMVTTHFEAIFLQLTLKVFFETAQEENYFESIITALVSFPYSFSNLDFYRIINSDTCLSKGLRVVDILALRYLSALYPLLLLLIAYIIIELQAMNVRPVLWLLKVVCFPCVRWRRVWKAKISILDTFAAYIVLSYSKFMYISFLLLSYSKVEGKGKNRHVLTIDPAIKYLSDGHKPFVILSVVVILTFGIIPPLLLLFYQLKTCVSCLKRLHMHRPGLEQFIQAFQGCYKDGTNGTGDRRFFAGLYFVFRLIMVLVYTQTPTTTDTLNFKTAFFVFFLFVCAVSQPYKKPVYTFLDCFFFTILGCISVTQFTIYASLLENNHVPRSLLIYVLLLCIPLIYMTCYLLYRLFLCFKNRDSNRYLLLNNDDDDTGETTPERVERRVPVTLDISPRPSITHTEVSIAELSQQEDCSDNENNDRETSPLLKKREMKIFSQHAATLSQEYSAY